MKPEPFRLLIAAMHYSFLNYYYKRFPVSVTVLKSYSAVSFRCLSVLFVLNQNQGLIKPRSSRVWTVTHGAKADVLPLKLLLHADCWLMADFRCLHGSQRVQSCR